MATTTSILLQALSLRRLHNAPPTSSEAYAPKPAPISRTTALPGRRQWLFLLTATTALKAIELPSRAEDIPLFGLRKKLKKVEEEAEEIIKEGIEAAEKGIKTAERGIETAEKEIETAALKAIELPSRAEDIPLFGLRKKLKKVEEEAEEIIKEGIKTAERGIETAEKEIETAEEEIETAVSFGGIAQAGVVVGAEAIGILVATSVVNGILGPEGQKS